MKRVLAYVLLFVERLRGRKGRRHSMKLRHQSDKLYTLTFEDLSISFIVLVKMVQAQYFLDSINAVKINKKDFKLCSLNPFLDHHSKSWWSFKKF